MRRGSAARAWGMPRPSTRLTASRALGACASLRTARVIQLGRARHEHGPSSGRSASRRARLVCTRVPPTRRQGPSIARPAAGLRWTSLKRHSVWPPPEWRSCAPHSRSAWSIPLTRRFRRSAARLRPADLHGPHQRPDVSHADATCSSDGDDYVFALTYGSDVQWVKNVRRGRRVRDQGPWARRAAGRTQSCSSTRPAATHASPCPAQFLRLNRVSEFLRMRAA